MLVLPMLPIEFRIERARRLLRMIEEDAPLLSARVAPLSLEQQNSVKSYAQELEERTRAEIQRLLKEQKFTVASD
jgi:hypothetical protein